MLKKLLKYDLKNVFKFIVIFYVLSVVFALLTRLFASMGNSLVLEIFSGICSGAAHSMLVSVIINTLMRSWVRFKQNLYGDESYITHTLPVTKHAIYLSKFLTAIIVLFVSVVVSVGALFVIYYSEENMAFLKSFLFSASTMVGDSFTPIIICTVLVLFLEFAAALQCGFCGILLGHKMHRGKTGFSVLFGFIAYAVSQAIGVLVLFGVALFNADIMSAFTESAVLSPATVQTLLLAAAAAYTIVLVIGYIFNVKLFQKGVNVD